MKRGLCRFCGEPIVWVMSENGRTMPLNPLPVADGNVVAHNTGKGIRARVLTTAMNAGTTYAQVTRYVHHAATCANRPGARPANQRSSTHEESS